MTAVFDPLESLIEHEPWLRTTLYSRLGDPDEVDEVMQEVAVAAVSQSAKAEPIERVGPWLYRVAIRQVLLFRRKAGRRRRALKNAEHFRANGVQPVRAPLEFLLHEERQCQVRQAMKTLPERDRQVLMLKYVDGFSYSEIADQIGVTASAVQSRLHRARALLKQRLRIYEG